MSRLKTIPVVVVAVVLAGCLTLFSAFFAYSQESPSHARRTVLQKHDLSVPGREGVMVLTELDPGAQEPKHTHPGDIFAFVEQGSVTLMQDGKPTSHLKAGEVFFVPAGTVHSASNEGPTTVKMLVTFFVEKGKPLTTPVK